MKKQDKTIVIPAIIIIGLLGWALWPLVLFSGSYSTELSCSLEKTIKESNHFICTSRPCEYSSSTGLWHLWCDECESGYEYSGGQCVAIFGGGDTGDGDEEFVCTHGATECWDSNTLATCYNNAWSPATCQYGCESYFGGAECRTSPPEEPDDEDFVCTSGAKKCEDSNTLATCYNNRWSYASCPYGCESYFGGAECKDEPEGSCSDSDYGKNYVTKGTVSESWFGGGASYIDYCTTSTKVKEYYCSGNDVQSVIYDCASAGNYICNNGKCVQSSTPSECTSKCYNSTHHQTSTCNLIYCVKGCVNNECKQLTINDCPTKCVGDNLYYIKSGTSIANAQGQCNYAIKSCSEGCSNNACNPRTTPTGETRFCPLENKDIPESEYTDERCAISEDALLKEGEEAGETFPTPPWVPDPLKKTATLSGGKDISYFWILMGAIALIMGFLIFKARGPRKRRRR